MYHKIKFYIALFLVSLYSYSQEGIAVYSDYLSDNYYLLHPLLTLCYLETGNKDRFLNQISLLPKDRLTVLSKINHIHFNPVHDKIMPRSKDLSSILIKNINNYN